MSHQSIRAKKARLFTAFAAICLFCVPICLALPTDVSNIQVSSDFLVRSMYHGIIALVLVVSVVCSIQLRKLLNEVSRLEQKISNLERVNNTQWKKIDKQQRVINHHEATIQGIYDSIDQFCVLYDKDAPKELLVATLEALKRRISWKIERSNELRVDTPVPVEKNDEDQQDEVDISPGDQE